MTVELPGNVEAKVAESATQFDPGVLVRVKQTGLLLRVESILPNGRLWLVNQSLVISVAAQDVELAVDPKKRHRSSRTIE
jgi:hypothetical protein